MRFIAPIFAAVSFITAAVTLPAAGGNPPNAPWAIKIDLITEHQTKHLMYNAEYFDSGEACVAALDSESFKHAMDDFVEFIKKNFGEDAKLNNLRCEMLGTPS